MNNRLEVFASLLANFSLSTSAIVGLKKAGITAFKWYLKPLKHCHIKNSTTALLVSLLATCQPSYAITKSYPIQISDNNVSLDKVAVSGNYGLLSKSNSVTPQRHCGFFAPVICLASQAKYKYDVSAAASHLRLQSVSDGMTRPNKPMANKSGGSVRPRVNPVTLISQISVTKNSKLTGVVNHG